MRLKNFLIVVKDLERAKEFYRALFGMQVILEQGANVILTDGLVLQEAGVWKECIGEEIVQNSNGCELYFEEKEIEQFVQKLGQLYPETLFVTPLTESPWGQKVVRFYDPDGHLIEVRTPA